MSDSWVCLGGLPVVRDRQRSFCTYSRVKMSYMSVKPGTHMRAKPRNVTDSCNKFVSVDMTSSPSNEQEMLVARVSLRSTRWRFLPVASKECYITRYAMCVDGTSTLINWLRSLLNSLTPLKFVSNNHALV